MVNIDQNNAANPTNVTDLDATTLQRFNDASVNLENVFNDLVAKAAPAQAQTQEVSNDAAQQIASLTDQNNTLKQQLDDKSNAYDALRAEYLANINKLADEMEKLAARGKDALAAH